MALFSTITDQCPAIFCHHVRVPTTLVTFFHRPYVWMELLPQFLANITKILWEIVQMAKELVKFDAYVKTGKEVKTGTGTSAQYGMGSRAELNITIIPIFFLSLIPSRHIYHAKTTIIMVIFGLMPYHRNSKPHQTDFVLGAKAQPFCTMFLHLVGCPRLVLVP